MDWNIEWKLKVEDWKKPHNAEKISVVGTINLHNAENLKTDWNWSTTYNDKTVEASEVAFFMVAWLPDSTVCENVVRN